MEDGQGTRVDFKNTIILLTSNVGSDVLMAACGNGKCNPSDTELQALMRPALLRAFPAALLGRMMVIPYYPLGDATLGRIVELQVARIATRIKQQYGVPLEYDPALIALVASRCSEVESGGRMIDAVLTNSLLPQLSRKLLMRRLEGTALESARVDVEDGDLRVSLLP